MDVTAVRTRVVDDPLIVIKSFRPYVWIYLPIEFSLRV